MIHDLTIHHQVNKSAAAIYTGTIRHRRFSPRSHQFRYRIKMLMLDLDFLEEDLNGGPLFSASQPSLGWFRRGDYIGDANAELKATILDRVECVTGSRPQGKVLLMTHLRYWGFIMNPISIFYCYTRTGELAAVALQVTNTPWREKILYVLPVQMRGRNFSTRFTKNLHVSPFNPMGMEYLCRLQPPSSKLFFHLENFVADEKVTDATMVFSGKPLTKSSLMALCLQQPAMTLKVGAGIYWQALRLWLKGVPVFDHPDRHPSPKKLIETPE